MKSLRLPPVILSLCAVCLALASVPNAGGQDPAPYTQASVPLEERVQNLLALLTIEEKARQLDLYSASTNGAPAILDHLRNETHAAADSHFLPEGAAQLWGTMGVGAIHDLYPSPELANEIQAWVITHDRLHIPVLFIEEGVHGSLSYGDTVFPAPIGLGTAWDTNLAHRTGAVIAAEMRARGIDMCLGPVLDLARDPRWGRIEEDFGEDPYLTGQLGLAYVQAMQGDSLATDRTVIAEPKHFAGHGSPEGGLNTSPVHIGEREMRTMMLKSFEPAIVQGKAMAVMAAYHDIDGLPCTANPWLLLQVLRGEMGFRGFVLSDLGAVRRLQTVHHVAATPADAICLAIKSGVDMQFYDYPHDVFQRAIVEGIQSGKLPAEALDRAVSGVLRAKFLLGLFDHPFTDVSLDAKVARAQPHLEAALQSARESMCLLKNDQHLLPLSRSLKKVAVIGPNGDQARLGDYADQAIGKTYSILDGIQASLPAADIVFDHGDDIPAAAAKASAADVVIAALGERHGLSGEGFDRSSLDLPGNQEALLEALVAAGRPVVLVLENGRPLSITWAAAHVPAILEAWYPGEFGGLAVAQTLFGDNNPAGRLPISFPRGVGEIPVFYDHEPSAHVESYVGAGSKPLFAFGTGLSYTAFKYGQLIIAAPADRSKNDLAVAVNVTNTGSVEGDEVAQLYVRQETASVETPIEALKGFRRLHLKPGETQTVRFSVPPSELAVWNAQGRWEVEPGDFTVKVGGSLEGDLNGKFTLK
jgi:beta-glucosidase